MPFFSETRLFFVQTGNGFWNPTPEPPRKRPLTPGAFHFIDIAMKPLLCLCKSAGNGLKGLFLGLLGLAACKNSPEPEPALVGQADASRYVAIGASVTAGMMNGGLYRAGQLAAYPNLLARQLALVSGRQEFNQPLFAETEENGTGYQVLTSLSPLRYEAVTANLALRSQNPRLYTKFTGDNQNLGVPSLRVADVNVPGYGSATGNALFERLLPAGQEQKTYAQYVTESRPTFFTFWLGDADLAEFVTSGGTRPLTEPGLFSTNVNLLFDALARQGAKGVVANLPDPTLLPLLMRPGELAAFRKDAFTPYWITTGTGEVRTATESDRILMSADSIGFLTRAGFSKGFFKIAPLNNDDVLDVAEIEQVQQALNAYNATLSAEANARNWPLLDANALFQKTDTGYLDFFGNRVESDFFRDGQLLPNSIFSVDGVSLNPRGQALMANEFIAVINQAYQAQIPLLNLSQFEGPRLAR